MVLRDYQLTAISSLRELFKAGHRQILLVSPTGSGKTIIAAELVRLAVAKGSRVVFIAHRTELIEQTYNKLKDIGIIASVVKADDPRANKALPVQVCSVQTLSRRQDYPPAEVVIYDECHHIMSNSSRKLLEYYQNSLLLGLTATPFRTDKLGLDEIFKAHHVAATPRELIDAGYLVDLEAYGFESPDLTDVKTVAGDFHQGQLEIACMNPKVFGAIVDEYVRHGGGRRALLFCVGVKQSLALTEAFQARGIQAVHLDFETHATIRQQTLADFAEGSVRIVSSCGILTEGFDCPAASMAILARPTKSLTLFLQMCGRVLRPSDGKQAALFHDHGKNFDRHGFPTDDRDWSPQTTPRYVRDTHTCLYCQFLFATHVCKEDGKYCPKCFRFLAGYEPNEKFCKSCTWFGEAEELEEGCCPECGELLVKGRKIDYEPGERIKLTSVYASQRDPFPPITDYTQDTYEERYRYYRELQETAKTRGYKKGWIGYRFSSRYGYWPRYTD